MWTRSTPTRWLSGSGGDASELDPHSTYLSARETERTDEMMRGNFEGVGLVIRRDGDTSFVGQVLADGPSAGSGILPGDSLLGRRRWTAAASACRADSVVSWPARPQGTTVDVDIRRKGEPIAFTIAAGL